jgi:hypothetical protein
VVGATLSAASDLEAEDKMTFYKSGDLRLRVEGEQVVSETGEVFDIRETILRIPWTTATKYAASSPHQYVVQSRCPSELWAVLACFIAKHPDGYEAYFRGYQRPMHYIELDQFRYWRTASGGFGGGVTHMLNRCTFDSAEPPRRADQGAKPIPNWQGPPWELNGTPWPDWYVRQPDGSYRYERDRDPYRPKSRKRNP